MHKYMILRGAPNLMRRCLEDLQDVYLNYKNKITGEHIGAIQLMPREVKTIELVFPATAKKEIKDIVKRVFAKHNKDQNGGVTIHWGPWKKDKFDDGVERL